MEINSITFILQEIETLILKANQQVDGLTDLGELSSCEETVTHIIEGIKLFFKERLWLKKSLKPEKAPLSVANEQRRPEGYFEMLYATLKSVLELVIKIAPYLPITLQQRIIYVLFNPKPLAKIETVMEQYAVNV